MSDWVRETLRRYLAETPRPRIIIEGAGREYVDLRAAGYAEAIADVVAFLRAPTAFTWAHKDAKRIADALEAGKARGAAAERGSGDDQR